MKNKFNFKFLSLLPIAIILVSFHSLAQTKTWNGSAGTSWSVAANWTASNGAANGIPTASDNVVISIATNDPIISSGVNAVAKSIRLTVLNSGLTINSGASLTVSTDAGSAISVERGTLTNNGTLSVTNTNAATNTSVDDCIRLLNGGKVDNSSVMTLEGGLNNTISVLTGAFTNLSGGNITATGYSILRMGNANSGFTNSSGATFTGTGTNSSLSVNPGVFSNTDIMNLTGNVEVFGDGTNPTTLSVTSNGILNVTGTFYNQNGAVVTNVGQLNITGDFFNSSTFNNTNCGKTKVVGNYNNGATLSTNSGLLEITGNFTNPSAASFTNNGVLLANSYPTFNNRRIRINTNQADNTNIFAISTAGGTSTINGIFRDAATTISAGTYTQSSNTFNATLPFSGATTLYAKITQGSCVYVVPFVFILPPTRRYVKTVASGTGDGSSWANAGTLQEMINASRNIDSVWVASGVYKPQANAAGETTPADARQKVFYMKSGVKIFGGFAGTEVSFSQRDFKNNKTIFNGDIDNNDINTDGNNIAELSTDIQGNNVFQLLIIAQCDKTTQVDGFVFTAAKSNTTTTPAQTVNGSSITPDLGSAINITSSYPTIKNCVFSGNYGGFFGNVYQNNITSPYVDTVKVISSFFIGNYAQFGGGLLIRRGHHYSSNLVMVNNTSDFGGAILVQNNMSPSGTVDFINATIVNNYSSNGKAVRVDAGNVKFVNSIVYNTTPYSAGEILNSGSQTALTCSYSILPNSSTSGVWNNNYGTDGGNNIDVNPQFLNIADLDGIDNKLFTADDGLSLTLCPSASPAANAGTNIGVQSTDITSSPRLFGNRTDIGAYELQQPVVSSNINLTANISSTSTYASSNTITATNGILAGANVRYLANNSIMLNPQSGGGFTVNAGAVFEAKIQPLVGCN